AGRNGDVLRDRGPRESGAGESVDPALPVDLGDLLGDARAELGLQAVPPGAEHPLDRRVRVCLAAAATAADVATLDAAEPLFAERLERRPKLRQFREVVSALAQGHEPGKRLAAVFAGS